VLRAVVVGDVEEVEEHDVGAERLDLVGAALQRRERLETRRVARVVRVVLRVQHDIELRVGDAVAHSSKHRDLIGAERRVIVEPDQAAEISRPERLDAVARVADAFCRGRACLGQRPVVLLVQACQHDAVEHAVAVECGDVRTGVLADQAGSEDSDRRERDRSHSPTTSQPTCHRPCDVNLADPLRVTG